MDTEDAPVTISSVARLAGVSTATVSRVLQGTASTSKDARGRVLDAVRVLGYQPPVRAGSRPRRHGHGLVLPDLSSYHSGILVGVASVSADAGEGLRLLVTERHTDVTSRAREMAGSVSGLVVAGGAMPDPVVQGIARSTPVVLVGRSALPRCDAVMAENVQTSQALTRHLFEHGCTRLVFVGDPDTTPEIAQRYQGFRLAHAAAAVPIRRPPLRVPLIQGAGRHVAEEVQRRRVRVDGLVCASDEIALGLIGRLAETDLLVPQDLAVVGWGDLEAARFVHPAVTTVRHPVRQLGSAAALQLVRLIAGQEASGDTQVLPTEIVLRESCGCPGPASHPPGGSPTRLGAGRPAPRVQR